MLPEPTQKARNLYSLSSHLILMTEILELWGKDVCHFVLCVIIFKKSRENRKEPVKLGHLKIGKEAQSVENPGQDSLRDHPDSFFLVNF